MADKLDWALFEEYGVDTAQLVKDYGDIVPERVFEEYGNIIKALGTAILVSGMHGMPLDYYGAMRMLFAVGYAAGKSEPDLSVFEGVLEDS